MDILYVIYESLPKIIWRLHVDPWLFLRIDNHKTFWAQIKIDIMIIVHSLILKVIYWISSLNLIKNM